MNYWDFDIVRVYGFERFYVADTHSCESDTFLEADRIRDIVGEKFLSTVKYDVDERGFVFHHEKREAERLLRALELKRDLEGYSEVLAALQD
jgi:hypothetical protein